MGKGKQQRKLTFKEAVEATPDVASGYQEGINAFSNKYTVEKCVEAVIR